VDAKSFPLTAASVSNGAIGLLDEVAATKITGEEELFSHTDLSDFRANVDGAERAYQGLRDVAKAKDPALVTTLDARFAALDTLLRHHGTVDDGFVSYTSLTKTQVKALSDAVNAVSEPLSTLTATVLQ
jgi:iron uptake system component EfeO